MVGTQVAPDDPAGRTPQSPTGGEREQEPGTDHCEPSAVSRKEEGLLVWPAGEAYVVASDGLMRGHAWHPSALLQECHPTSGFVLGDWAVGPP